MENSRLFGQIYSDVRLSRTPRETMAQITLQSAMTLGHWRARMWCHGFKSALNVLKPAFKGIFEALQGPGHGPDHPAGGHEELEGRVRLQSN